MQRYNRWAGGPHLYCSRCINFQRQINYAHYRPTCCVCLLYTLQYLGYFLTSTSPVGYTYPVWHSRLTVARSKVLECLQKRLLNIIFPGSEYMTNLIIANVETLSRPRRQLYSYSFSSDGHQFGGHGPLPPPLDPPLRMYCRSGTGGTLLHRRRADASCSFTRWQYRYFSAWNDVVTAILKVWREIEKQTQQSIPIYLKHNPTKFCPDPI